MNVGEAGARLAELHDAIVELDDVLDSIEYVRTRTVDLDDIIALSRRTDRARQLRAVAEVEALAIRSLFAGMLS